jgi:transposase InsO family protein
MRTKIQFRTDATTIDELNEQLTRFRQIYNQERPHRSLDRRTPAAQTANSP